MRDIENERCDQLAVEAAIAPRSAADQGYKKARK